MRNWAELPEDLLLSTEKHLISYYDKAIIRFVCKSWRSSLPNLPTFKQIPGLLFPYHELPLCGFLNPFDNQVHNFHIPKKREKLFKGSCHGWVIMIEEDGAMFAFNPLTQSTQYLPHRNTFPDVIEYHLERPNMEFSLSYLSGDLTTTTNLAHTRFQLTGKVVLSSSPISSDCVAVAIYGAFSDLAYCRFGDEKWYPLISGTSNPFCDVIFHKGHFYALDYFGDIHICEIGNSPIVTKLNVTDSRCYAAEYLVECCGELLSIHREIDYPENDQLGLKFMSGHTSGFIIDKLDKSNLTWSPQNNLRDNILFLGYNSSFAVSSRDFPEYKRNCIYFTDDNDEMFDYNRKDNDFDEGVYSFDSLDIKLLPGCGSDNEDLIWPKVIWFTPNHREMSYGV